MIQKLGTEAEAVDRGSDVKKLKKQGVTDGPTEYRIFTGLKIIKRNQFASSVSE